MLWRLRHIFAVRLGERALEASCRRAVWRSYLSVTQEHGLWRRGLGGRSTQHAVTCMRFAPHLFLLVSWYQSPVLEFWVCNSNSFSLPGTNTRRVESLSLREDLSVSIDLLARSNLQHLILISGENVITARAKLPSLHPSPPSEASSCVLHLIDEGPYER